MKPAKKRPAGRRRPKRAIAAVAAALLAAAALICLTAGGYLLHALDLIVYENELEIDYPESLPLESGEEPPESGEAVIPEQYQTNDVANIPVKGDTEDIYNLLLLGIDARTVREAGRSDAIMVLSLNRRDKTIRLSSLLRDIAVSIPGRDKDGDGRDDLSKLTNAYAFGGFPLLQKTIEQNFRLKIDRYIGANFVTFPIAVDALGGVDVELTAAETAHVPRADVPIQAGFAGFQRIGTQAGEYHLDGFQTLQYVRIRKVGDDFARSGRQRKVIGQLLGKAKNMNVGQLIAILEKVLPEVVTNMTADELLGFAVDVASYKEYGIDADFLMPERQHCSYGVPLPDGSKPTWLNDPVREVQLLHERIYG